jgi:hypothetical protein
MPCLVSEQTPCVDQHVSKRMNCTRKSSSSASSVVCGTLTCTPIPSVCCVIFADDSVQLGQRTVSLPGNDRLILEVTYH